MALSETAQLLVSLRLQDELTGGLTKAKGELATLESQATSTSSKVGSAFKGMGTAIAAGVAAFGAFKVAEFLGGAVQAAREEEASIARLTASLKANVEAWDGNVQAVEAHIEANTKAAFSDDELRQSLGSLVAATHDVTRAFEDQQTAIDLARFTGKSLEEATQTIIAVEAGRFRGLAQLGISIKGVTTAEQALAKIRDVVAGQGQAFLETDAGKAQKLKVSIDELSESFGRFASGPLADAGVALAGFFDQLSGVAAASLQTQGQAIATNAAEFVKHATKEQLLAAEEEIRQSIIRQKALLAAVQGIPGIGQIASPEQIAALAAAERVLATLDRGIQTFGADFDDNTDRMKHGVDELAASLAGTGSVSFRSFSTAAEETGSALDQIDLNARAAATGLDITHKAVSGVKDALDGLPREIPIDINVGLFGAGAGLLAQGGLSLGNVGAAGNQPTDTGSLPFANSNQNQIDLANKRTQTATENARKAKQAADDLARAYAEKVSNAYDKAKRASDFLFDALHDRHLKAIHDAEALAQKQHDNAVDQIEDALKVAKAQNALAANQAQQQQDSISRARTLRDLRENLADSLAALAKNPNDIGAQRGVRGAREALADFNAQQNIAALQSVQAAKDKAAEAAAQLARDQADADLEAAKLKATAAEQLANKADAKQKQQFDLALEALKKKDIGDPAKFLVDVKALQAKFGIFSDERGFQHIGDVVAGALKNVVIPTPHITLNTTPSFILKLGPVELKGIAAAVASTANPSQAGSTRTGQSQPRPT